MGITRDDIMKKHKAVYDTRISMDVLRFDIIPTLYSSGLITKGKSKEDARIELIFISDSHTQKNNSVVDRGVETIEVIDENPHNLNQLR